MYRTNAKSVGVKGVVYIDGDKYLELAKHKIQNKNSVFCQKIERKQDVI